MKTSVIMVWPWTFLLDSAVADLFLFAFLG